jgi:carbonic anhydrase
MEFANAVAGSKLIAVLGHTSCGAAQHAIDDTDAAELGMNNLQTYLMISGKYLIAIKT